MGRVVVLGEEARPPVWTCSRVGNSGSLGSIWRRTVRRTAQDAPSRWPGRSGVDEVNAEAAQAERKTRER